MENDEPALRGSLERLEARNPLTPEEPLRIVLPEVSDHTVIIVREA